MIYFDNSATSLIKPYIVKKEVLNAIENLSANPGRSGHDLSLRVSQKIFETRENLKQFFHAENYDVAFTKNCTEAINLVIFSMLKKGDSSKIRLEKESYVRILEIRLEYLRMKLRTAQERGRTKDVERLTHEISLIEIQIWMTTKSVY